MVSAPFQEQAGQVGVAEYSRVVQGSLSRTVKLVHIRAVYQQQLHRFPAVLRR